MTNALPPAHWAADPSGRHEFRYWDGARWTDHVSDRGAASIDPLAGPAAADTALSPEPTAVAPEPIVPEPVVPEPVAPEPVAPEPVAPGPEFELLRAGSEGTISPVDSGGPGWAAPAGALRPPPPPPPLPGTGYAGAGARASSAADWRSMNGLKTALVVLFVCIAVASVASLGVHLNRMAAADNFENRPSFTTAQDLQDADDAVDGVSAVLGLLQVAIVVCFIIWMFRAAKNMIALRRDGARFGPGWSIGGWFIPFANLVIPVMIVQGFWRASTPGTHPGDDWRRRSGSALVGWWWAALLLTAGSNFTWNENRTLDDVRASDTVSSFSSAASVVAAVLAIMLVVQLTRRFNDRRAETPSV